MNIKTKTWILAFQLLILWSFIFCLSQFPSFVDNYSQQIYPHIQSVRLMVFDISPISIGDIVYVLLGGWLLLTLLRWVYYIRKWRVYSDKLAGSFLNLLNTVLLAYFLFLLFWGANYNKEPLGKSWELPMAPKQSRQDRRASDLASVIAFNEFLLRKLNKTAPQYSQLPYEQVNQRAKAYYRSFTDSRVKEYGLNIKATLFGYFMQRMSVDGYYNPFTGEGQVNMDVPHYMMPFTVCHEMAHQAGIAAEGDANLMSYALCTRSRDLNFQYSAYLNLWLYANSRLYRYDSAIANGYEAKLNGLTRAHIDTLEQINRKYRGLTSRYTAEIYDSYLRMQHQENGIKSYGNVTREAWLLEQKHTSRNTQIKIP
jgi:hypothetical protein